MVGRGRFSERGGVGREGLDGKGGEGGGKVREKNIKLYRNRIEES